MFSNTVSSNTTNKVAIVMNIWLFVIAFSCLVSTVIATDDGLLQRVRPEGKLCLAARPCTGETPNNKVDTRLALASTRGEEIYSSRCIACHLTGAAGSPKLGDAEAWSSRVAKGMDVLYNNVINGFKGMPAKGLCMKCSDEELKAVVDYMIEKSK